MTAKERRDYLERETGVGLDHIGRFSFDEADIAGKNCENLIGATQVPCGIAGPLNVMHSGEKVLRRYYVPLATTEGALVASVNRGCKAISVSGGAVSDSIPVGASRGPVFRVTGIRHGREVREFLEQSFNEIKRIAEATSGHLTLKSVTSRMVGMDFFVRFVYDTGEAMGLNMVTIATSAACRFIEEQTGAKCLALTGNFCVDKKPAWQNFLNNRGTAVWSEAVFPRDVLGDVLKTDAETVYRTWLAKCMVGSALSGSMGFNAHYANVVAAVFIATGQDPAHAVEGSIGITSASVVNTHDLYLSVYLPDLLVGTVGGGTRLDTQREALSLMGVGAGDQGEAKVRLAEAIGGAVLAGEVSLLSSLGEGSLARAHKTLGRGDTSRTRRR